jgi:hypothetical protein
MAQGHAITTAVRAGPDVRQIAAQLGGGHMAPAVELEARGRAVGLSSARFRVARPAVSSPGLVLTIVVRPPSSTTPVQPEREEDATDVKT